MTTLGEGVGADGAPLVNEDGSHFDGGIVKALVKSPEGVYIHPLIACVGWYLHNTHTCNHMSQPLTGV